MNHDVDNDHFPISASATSKSEEITLSGKTHIGGKRQRDDKVNDSPRTAAIAATNKLLRAAKPKPPPMPMKSTTSDEEEE